LDISPTQFVLFGLAVALISNLSRSPVWRSVVLLTASLLFLGVQAPAPIAVLPLTGFLLLGYAGLLLVERRGSRWLTAMVLCVILAFVWLKKYTLLPGGAFLRFPYLTAGLSYIFFRVLHLIIDTGESDERRHVGIGSYLLYTLNFTTLVSGPIQRYDEFARDQFAGEPIGLGPQVVGLQLERIVRGFFKVTVLAMLLHGFQEDAVAQLAQPLSVGLRMYAAVRLVVLYPLFLYANFSGYIDIVIAVARLMRLQLPENFNRPFSASSILDFWNRWHMTLSTWLKIYVYNSLLAALMRRVSVPSVQQFLAVLCFFVTFFLIGIWHGRTSEFVVFGVLQGGGVAANKVWQLWMAKRLGSKRYKTLAKNPTYLTWGRGLTFSWYAFTSLWFWADWKQLNTMFAALNAAQWFGVSIAIVLCTTTVLAGWEWLRARLLAITIGGEVCVTSRYARVVYASALGLAAFIITVLLNQPAPDIVYKAF
jgi:alginate O-acetyltransferase complex protein AlgI